MSELYRDAKFGIFYGRDFGNMGKTIRNCIYPMGHGICRCFVTDGIREILRFLEWLPALPPRLGSPKSTYRIFSINRRAPNKRRADKVEF